MTLESTFYVLAIITMILMLAILTALLAAILVIRAKIVSLHETIEQKLKFADTILGSGSSVLKKVKQTVDKAH
jgi:cell division protein FtsL